MSNANCLSLVTVDDRIWWMNLYSYSSSLSSYHDDDFFDDSSLHLARLCHSFWLVFFYTQHFSCIFMWNLTINSTFTLSRYNYITSFTFTSIYSFTPYFRSLTLEYLTEFSETFHWIFPAISKNAAAVYASRVWTLFFLLLFLFFLFFYSLSLSASHSCAFFSLPFERSAFIVRSNLLAACSRIFTYINAYSDAWTAKTDCATKNI